MKRSYHSDVAIRYKLDILPDTIRKQIPSSTLHNWKQKDFSCLFGPDAAFYQDEEINLIRDFLSKKYLLKAARAIYFVYKTYGQIFAGIKNKHKIFRESKELIINTIDKIKECIGFNRALKAFSISYQQYYAWNNTLACAENPANLCRKIFVNQLTKKETNTVLQYLKNPKFIKWNLAPVYYQMLREKAAFFSLTTFYKYAHRFKLTRAKPERKKYLTGIRSYASKKLLHMDVTIYRPLDHSKVYIYFLVDNFSRYIMNWKASLNYSAKIAFENISEAYEKFNLSKIYPQVELITDNGSENKAQVDEFVNSPCINIQKIIAQTDIIFSNSMVEAVNKRMKYDFLFTTNLLNIEQTTQFLKVAVNQYNQKPHTALYGLTPEEVFNGHIPDKNMFAPAIKHAASKRKEINMKENCKNCR